MPRFVALAMTCSILMACANGQIDRTDHFYGDTSYGLVIGG
ncbi:MAG: hypothetical protein P8Q36_07660 [Alphaproteobacteria bacterium]|nr:hypothetical protein [Alphaproteobacteria bacterium]